MKLGDLKVPSFPLSLALTLVYINRLCDLHVLGSDVLLDTGLKGLAVAFDLFRGFILSVGLLATALLRGLLLLFVIHDKVLHVVGGLK